MTENPQPNPTNVTSSEEMEPLTGGAVLAAIVAGHSTEDALAAHLGVPAGPCAPLWRLLNQLVCGGLVEMEVVDRDWHYRPIAAALEADHRGLTPGQRGLARGVLDELTCAVNAGKATGFADVIEALDAPDADKWAVHAAIGGNP